MDFGWISLISLIGNLFRSKPEPRLKSIRRARKVTDIIFTLIVLLVSVWVVKIVFS